MRKVDDHSIDEYTAFGMRAYRVDLQKPLGGRLKTTSESFHVEEIDDEGIRVSQLSKSSVTGGLYLRGVLYRVGMSHQHSIGLIAKHYRTSLANVQFAGIKDTQASIIQQYAIFDIDPHVSLEPVELHPNLRIEPLGLSNKGLPKGHIYGNHFKIDIEDSNILDQDQLDTLKMELSEKGTWNYYGVQRFGGLRPITAKFGQALLKKQYQEAVDIYLGGRSWAEEDQYRKLWRDTNDPQLLLEEWLDIPHNEKKLCEALIDKPHSYQRALGRLPDYLLEFSQQAVLSLLFNQYLSIREGMNQGERVVKHNGRENIEIALPSNRWPKPLNRYWGKLFEENALKLQHFKSFKHRSRMAILYPDDLKLQTNKDRIQAEFSLPTGSYATTMLREIMRSPVSSYV